MSISTLTRLKSVTAAAWWARTVQLAKIAALLGAIVLPLTLHNAYYLRIVVLALVYFMLAMGYSILITNTAVFEFGYTAYFALGAYLSALLTLDAHLSFWLVLPTSVIATVIVTMLLTVPVLRFRGDYLAIVTLGFAELLRLTILNWTSLTSGPRGLPGITQPTIFGFTFRSAIPYYYLALVLSLLIILVVHRLVNSGVGLAWSSIREFEDAGLAMGVNTAKYKRIAYAFASGIGAVAGVIFVHFQTIATPDVAVLDSTVIILAMAILGGGSIPGLLLSAFLLTIGPEVLRSLALYRMLVLGLLFIALMNLRPEGFTFGIGRHFRAPKRAEGQEGLSKEYGPGGPSITVLGESQEAPGPNRLPKSNGTAESALLETKGIGKRFGGLQALHAVDLKVFRGQIVSVIGPNGAGKTTLFNAITGVYKPTEGQVFLRGEDITGWPPYRVAQAGISRTFQNIQLFSNLTLLDNVMVARIARGVGGLAGALFPSRESEQRTQENIRVALSALAFVGLEGMEDALSRALSYGDKRRLEIARAIALGPDLLLVDEPTAGMTPREVEGIMDLLKQIRAGGVTILCIEHNMKVAMGISDRVLVIDYGMQIVEGSPEEVQQDQRVIEAYLGRHRGVPQ
jgi:branched-chain amino acid transport system permease protein